MKYAMATGVNAAAAIGEELMLQYHTNSEARVPSTVCGYRCALVAGS